MLSSVALIHSSAKEVPLLTQIAREVIADVKLLHMVDEGTQQMIEAAGGITEPVTQRISSYVMNAQEAGAEAAMLTSPDICRAIDTARAAVTIPVLRIDEPMTEAAVQFGTSIGVLAAHDVTLESTLAFLRERADAHRKDVAFDARLCEDAARALDHGDLEAYDHIIVKEAERLADNDTIVLADVMMCRATQTAEERLGIPVLSSPRRGFEDLAKKLDYFRR